MSLTELEEKFTKSEMAMMSWTSQEQSANLEKKSSVKPEASTARKPNLLKNDLVEDEDDDEEIDRSNLPEHIKNLPARFFNDEGELDLSKVSGKEAYAFFNAQGLRFMPVFRS